MSQEIPQEPKSTENMPLSDTDTVSENTSETVSEKAETPQNEAPEKTSFTEAEKKEAFDAVCSEILEHFKSFSPSEEVACSITEDHITAYLEGNKELKQQEFKERREKRLLTAFQLAAVLGTIVMIVKFLSSNPAVLVNILYIIGGLIALWIWKYPHDKEDN